MARKKKVPHFRGQHKRFVIQKLIEIEVNGQTYREIVIALYSEYPELVNEVSDSEAQACLISRVKKLKHTNREKIEAEKEKLMLEQRAQVQIPEDYNKCLEVRKQVQRTVMNELAYRLRNPMNLHDDRLRKLSKEFRASGEEFDRLNALQVENKPPNHKDWDPASEVQIVDYDEPNCGDFEKTGGAKEADQTEHTAPGDAGGSYDQSKRSKEPQSSQGRLENKHVRVDHNIKPTENSVSKLDPHSKPGDCAIVRFLTDEDGGAIRDEEGHGVQAEFEVPGRSRVALPTYGVHPANVDHPRDWQFWDFVPRKSPDDRLVGKFVDRRLCDGPLDRTSSPPKDAISEMGIDCPDHVRENHRVVEGWSPRLYPRLENRGTIH